MVILYIVRERLNTLHQAIEGVLCRFCTWYRHTIYSFRMTENPFWEAHT